jgi:cell wall-associated NlpC family hydrolase
MNETSMPRPLPHLGGRNASRPSSLEAAARRRATLTALVTFLSFPGGSAAAQARYALSPFAARNSSLAGTPTLVGASLTTYGSSLGGILGLRFGGAYDVRALGGSSASTDTERGWAADVDAVISPARLPVIGPLLGGFLPTLFPGVGVEGVRRDAGASGQSVVTSYGAGVSRAIGGGLAIETEARRRTPVSWSGSASDEATARRGWEYRLGLSFSFGGRSTRGGGIPGLPLPTGSRSSRRDEPAPSATAAAVLSTGDDYVGTRYTYGGATPASGFDCSGFVQYVFRRNGVVLPRTSRQQSAAGRALSTTLGDLRAGDLLFFSQNGDVVDHVAIYAGHDRILHSTSSGGGVRYDDLTSPRGRWFATRLIAARRVLGEGASFVDPPIAAQLEPKLDPPDRAPRPK